MLELLTKGVSMSHRIGILGILAALAPVGALAGATVTLHADSGDTVLLLDGNKMRSEKQAQAKESPGTEMIYDGDSQTMYLLHTREKTYTVMTPAKMQAQVGAAQAQIKSHMASMPPAQREQMKAAMEKMDPEARQRMEAMMNGGAAPAPAAEEKPRFEKTGKRQTVAGFSCDGYRQFRGNKLESQGCTIPWSSSAVAKEDMGALLKMQEFMKQGGMGWMGNGNSFAQLQELHGFPGEWSRVGEDGAEANKMTLTSIKHGSISADQFKVPAGYTEKELSHGDRH
jgi:hypothetical protein